MAKYCASRSTFTNIFLIASIVFLTVGSGYLARAGMHYSDAAEDDAISQEFSACADCMSNNQIIDAYAESLRGKMQGSLHGMSFHAGIGIALFSMGQAFQ